MKKIAILVFLLMGSIFGFSQTNYYVSNAGNNANDGSISSPWLTIQHGVNQLLPGDVLNIRGGIYEEKIDIDVSGTAGNYITIRNYQGEEVILDASNSPNDDSVIYTDNSYVRIEGLWIRNSEVNYAQGIFILGAAHHIEIIDNKISNINFSSNPNASVNSNTNAVPLYLLGNLASDSIHDILIRGNEVFDNRTGYSENISLGGNVSGFIIEDNIVHNNTNIGIDVTGNYGECPTPALDHGRNGIIRNNLVYNCLSEYSSSAGIYIDGGKDIVVENNTSHHNGYGGEIGCEEDGFTDQVIFRNNVFYLNASAGMHIGAYDENTTGVVTNSKVLNNTFYHNDTNNWFNGELLISQFENGEIMNNIFWINAQNVFLYSYRSQPGLVFDYNLVFTDGIENEIETTVNGNQSFQGLSAYYSATGYGAHSNYGNPLFIAPNSANPDFHIASNSPAIDAGNPAYVTDADDKDLDGNPRINNGVIDCGVDEYSNGNITLNLKVFLQGALDQNTLLMTDFLRTDSDFPLQEPYTTLGFDQVNGGGETINASVLSINGNDAIVDWVFIELRDGDTPATVLSTQAALLQRDGDIVGLDGISPVIFNSIAGVNQVYIAVRHRNHFGIRTMNSYSVDAPIAVDFTSLSTSIYGFNPTVILGSVQAMVAGDANRDGQVNAVDKNDYWRLQNGQPFDYFNSSADFNLDKVVNPVDKNGFWRLNNSKIEQLD